MSNTSQKAAESIREHAGTMRHKVWQSLVVFGPMTREEIEAVTGYGGNTVRPRVAELVKRRLVRETDQRRKTKSGREAVVLEAIQ